MYTRRAIVAGVVGTSVGLAGCSTNQTTGSNGGDESSSGGSSDEPVDSDDDGVPDQNDEYPNDPRRSVSNTNEGRIDIAEDEWSSWEFDWDNEVHLEYEMLVRSGPELEVFMMDKSEYRYFENGDRAQYYSGLSDSGAQLNAEGWVEPGEYVLVIENTDYGEIQPPTNLDDDAVRVEYELTLSR